MVFVPRCARLKRWRWPRLVKLVIAGVGGQGILTLVRLIGRACLIEGLNVIATETHGMAQRGGTVVAHVKMGDDAISPLVPPGGANVLIGLEVMEALRAYKYLNRDSTVILNDRVIITSLGGYLEVSKVEEKLKRLCGRVFIVNAFKEAIKLGNPRVENTYILGFFSALPENPLKPESYIEAIKRVLPKRYVDVNVEAFKRGRSVGIKTLENA